VPTKKLRDDAHDPRKAKGAKDKAAKMKAKSRTFDKKESAPKAKSKSGGSAMDWLKSKVSSGSAAGKVRDWQKKVGG
jgi:hypothetical protein